MKDLNKILLFLFLAAVVQSCKNESLESDKDSKESISERFYNLEKIGWKSRSYTQNIGKIGYTAIEVPIQYYLLKDLGAENVLSVDSVYNANNRERVIEFTFEEEKGKDLLSEEFTEMDYTNSVKYLSFSLDRDFYAVTSSHDTIPCSGVSYERNYKIAPFQRVLLFFSGISPTEKIQLVYHDQLFKNGTLKFQFNQTYTRIEL